MFWIQSFTVRLIPPCIQWRSMRSPAKRQTVKLTTWVKPGVKVELQRIAKAESLSLSRTGASALEEWLAGRLQVQYAGILQPMRKSIVMSFWLVPTGLLSTGYVLEKLVAGGQYFPQIQMVIRMDPGYPHSRKDVLSPYWFVLIGLLVSRDFWR